MEVEFLVSLKNSQSLRHTDPDTNTPYSTSWSYEDDQNSDEDIDSTVEGKNNGGEQLVQQRPLKTNISSRPNTLVACATAHSSYSKRDINQS